MSFYRIYRPQVIDEIDNVAVREALTLLLAKPKNDLPHAFLLSGPRGAGKTTAARVIAKLFNCTKRTKEGPASPAGGPCGTCEQCVSIAGGRNLDVLEIDAASNRGIDEIRTLRDGISLAPAAATHKVYIIDEVHMLTTEAFNALLKTLEEPPVHAVFVLATTDAQKVPVTIRSRCVSVVFSKATIDELVHALGRVVKKEKITIDKEALALIARSVDGSFRDAVKYLEQMSFHTGTISVEMVGSTLAVSDQNILTAFLGHLATKNAKEALALIEQLAHEGKDIKLFLTDCLGLLQTMLLARVLGKEAVDFSDLDVSAAIHKLSLAYTEMKGSPIAQLPLELAVVEYCEEQPSPAVSFTRPPAGEAGKGESINQPAVTPSAIDPRVSSTSLRVNKVEDDKGTGLLTLDHLTDHWSDFIAALKPYNHSVAGVMRSTRPKAVAGGIVVIEAFYSFHKDKLSEGKTRDTIAEVLKKLFGEKVKVEIVLGKK